MYFVNGANKTSGMKKMFEFRSSANEMEMKSDEFVSEKCLNEGTVKTFSERLFFILQPNNENLSYRNC